ncbi:MAG: DUF4199 family protein [Runella sp.]
MNNTSKYTLYIIAFSLVWLIGEKLLGYHNTIVDWLPFTSLLWLILVGIFYINFLQKERKSAIQWTYLRGVKAAFLLGCYWLIGFTLVKFLYYQLVNPGYFNDLLLRGREWLTMSATSEQNFENATRMMDDFLQIGPYLLITAIVQFVFCIVYALLFPTFVKKQS